MKNMNALSVEVAVRNGELKKMEAALAIADGVQERHILLELDTEGVDTVLKAMRNWVQAERNEIKELEQGLI